MLFETKIGRVVIKGMLLLELVRKRKGEGRRSCNGEQVLFASVISIAELIWAHRLVQFIIKKKQGVS